MITMSWYLNQILRESHVAKLLKLCLHVTFACASASMFVSKFCIELMVTQTHMQIIGSQPIFCMDTQSVNTST